MTIGAAAAAVVAVACCAGLPAIAAVAGGITVAAILGVAGVVLLAAALVAGVFLTVRARRRRGCPPQNREGAVMRLELLYFDGCPNHEALLPHLRDVLARAQVRARIELRRVDTPEDAERERFLGSPTVRIDGRDVDPSAAGREDYGMKCRLYATDEGLRGTPPDAWILRALRRGALEDTRRDVRRGEVDDRGDQTTRTQAPAG